MITPNNPRLEHWFITEDDAIVGFIYGDPRFEEGTVVTTGRVAELDVLSGHAITKKTKYILGERLIQGK